MLAALTGVVIALTACGSSTRAALSKSPAAATVTTTDPFVGSVNGALSGGPGAAGFDNSCNAQVNVSMCSAWAARDAQWARQVVNKLDALQVPAQYADETHKLVAALNDEGTADDALVAACSAAPAGANRQNDSALDAAVSRLGSVYSIELLAAIHPFDPYFGVLQ